MKNIARGFGSAALTLSLVLALIAGFAVPATAVDYAEPPSLTSLKLVSPSTVYEGDEFRAEWEAPANTTSGVLADRDSMGGQRAIFFSRDFSRDTGQVAVGLIDGSWVPGPYTLQYVVVNSSYGHVTYFSNGRVEKFPSGIRDPAPAVIDFASLSFRWDELGKFSNSPELSISGALTVGQTVKAVFPPLEPAAPVEYAWMHEDALGEYIGYGPTYVLKPEDMGKRIVARIWAIKRGYLNYERDSVPSEPVLGSFTQSGPATISGKAIVGQTLKVNIGTLTPTPEGLSYSWKRAGVTIAGANKSTYLLTTADAGKPISLTVSARKASYSTLVQRPATSTVLNIFTVTPSPTISGTARVGQVLMAKGQAWTPTASQTTFSWLRDGLVVDGATASTYTLTTADLGKKIAVKVTGRKSGYSPAFKTSASTAAVLTNAITGPRPVIKGTPGVGQTLTVQPGTWSPSGVTLSYQWKRNGAAIANATVTTYKPVAADVGTALTVTVIGRKSGYTAKSATSQPTTTVR